MDYTHRLSISYYKVAAPINEPHKVFLVRHQETGKFYVRKTLDVFSTEVYEQLRSNPVRGIPKIMDFNEEDGKLTLIEEFISGKTLREANLRKSGCMLISYMRDGVLVTNPKPDEPLLAGDSVWLAGEKSSVDWYK